MGVGRLLPGCIILGQCSTVRMLRQSIGCASLFPNNLRGEGVRLALPDAGQRVAVNTGEGTNVAGEFQPADRYAHGVVAEGYFGALYSVRGGQSALPKLKVL